jgi:hypothetical protein
LLIIDWHTLQFWPVKDFRHACTFTLASAFASSILVADTVIDLTRFISHPQVAQLIVALTFGDTV